MNIRFTEKYRVYEKYQLNSENYHTFLVYMQIIDMMLYIHFLQV